MRLWLELQWPLLAMLFFLTVWIRWRKRRRRFASRPLVPLADWFSTHYPDLSPRDRRVATEVLVAFAEGLGVDPSVLRPDDALEGDLFQSGWYAGPDSSRQDVAELLTELFDRRRGLEALSDAELETAFERWRTLDGCIRFFLERCGGAPADGAEATAV